MSIRPFDWRDLPALHRSRKKSVFLHSALVLTRGPMLISGALLSYLTPAMGIFTAVGTKNGDEDQSIIGQLIHPTTSQFAQLTFLSPEDALSSQSLPLLLDYLSSHAVERGAFRLLADVDERTEAYEVLRQSSFAIYARQRIWQISDDNERQMEVDGWDVASDRDLIPVRSLYNNLVPGLVQQVEPFPNDRLNGLVFRQGSDVLAYIELKYGHRGIWVQPFIHPDAEDVAQCLEELLHNLPYRRGRPVYLCIRSYQSWLETIVEDMGALPGNRQAVMVKHLAVPQKVVRSFALPALEGGHPEVSAPVVSSTIVRTQTAGSQGIQPEKQ